MATRRKKRLTIQGLFLWAVKLETCQLWITTRKESIEDALKKARKFIAKEKPGERILFINGHGTLDA